MTFHTTPTVSFVTVVRNDISGLKRTFESLRSLRYINFEWVVIDGDSSDGCLEFIEELTADFSILYRNFPPLGIYNAMNIGWRLSLGKYINFINAGDCVLPNISKKLNMTLSDLQESEFLATSVVHLTPLGAIYDISIPTTYSNRIVAANHQGCFVPKSALEYRSGFDESLRYAADGKFLDSLLMDHKMIVLPDACFSFLMGGASTLSYSSTLKEIATYREGDLPRINAFFLRLKTRIRLIIIRYERIFSPYLAFRSRKIQRVINKLRG